MSRRLIALLAVLAMTVLAACSSSTPEPSPVPTVTETKTETASPPAPSPSPTADWTVKGCDIEPNTNCKGADLSGANLRGAQLERSDLNGANLSEALLHRANLRFTSLHKSDLSAANLSHASLENSVLTGANLSHANLTNAIFTGASVTDVVWTHAYFCNTTMSDGTVDSSSCETPPSPSPSPTPGKAHITEFDMQATVHCVQRGRPQIKAFYATKDAVKIELTDVISNDGNTWNPKKTSGTAIVSFKCPRGDETKHVSQTYTLTAIAADGKETTATATVTSHAAKHRLGASDPS